MPTKIRQCVPCKEGGAADFQNQRYGRNQRVHVEFGKDASSKGVRCTVCGKETK